MLLSCALVLYQIEMAIETLQKSEGLSSQRSSLLNSHVSCFYQCLAPRPSQTPARLSPCRTGVGVGASLPLLPVFIVRVSPAFLLAAVEVLLQRCDPAHLALPFDPFVNL